MSRHDSTRDDPASMIAETFASTITLDHLTLRRVQPAGDPGTGALGANDGYDTAAIVGLWPFFVDGSLVTVLASVGARLESAELLTVLGAKVVRQLRAPEILLAVQLNAPTPVTYIDASVLEHEEVLLWVDPPRGYAATTPASLSAAFGAQSLVLPHHRGEQAAGAT